MSLPRTPVCALASLVLLAGCRDAPRASASPPAEASPAKSATVRQASPLVRVPAASLVCMVNDRFMGSEQIPVSVEGRTYFGCCAGCKEKLQNNAAVRTAADPVTRRPVDKASAVIGRTESGKVLYFETEATFAQYAARE